MSKKGNILDEVPAGTEAKVIGVTDAKQHFSKSTNLLSNNSLMRNVLVGAGVFLIILTVVGWYTSHKEDANRKKDIAFAEMIIKEEKAHGNGDDKTAKKLLTDFIAKYPHNSNKYQQYKINTAMAAIYSTAGDHKNAYVWQKKAFDLVLKHTFVDYYNLAETCRRNHDKTCAKENYQKALDAINHGEKPTSTDNFKTYINFQLEALEK